MEKEIKTPFELEIDLRKDLPNVQKNLFIEAGAGAGKTTSLVTRIVNMLMAGVKPSSIVAISFTNNSAEDLRKRIIAKLNELHQTKILNEIDLLNVSTIHKFCAKILRECFLDASLSPNFKVISPADDLTNKDLALKNNFKNIAIDWSVMKSFKKTRKEVYDDVSKLYRSLVDHIEKIPFENVFCDSKHNRKKIENDIKCWIREYILLINNYKDDLADIKNLTVEEILNKGRDKDFLLVANEEAVNDFLTRKLKLESIPFNGQKFRSGEPKELYNKVKADAEIIFKNLANLKDDYNNAYNSIIIEYAYKLYAIFLETIDQNNDELSNDESIYLAKKLLDNDKVVEKLQKKYTYICIDEYQDTDHLQRDIALKLTRNSGQFIDNSIYLVGDPKQSIYRFRGAEPDVFFETKELFELDINKNQVYYLNINFRSNNYILDWVNDNFSNIEMTDAKYTPMLCAPKNEIKSNDYLNDDNLIGVYKTEFEDEDDLADLILYLKENKKIRYTYKEKNEVTGQEEDKYAFRDIRFSDFMILMRANTKMSNYVEALNIKQIPTRVAGRADFGFQLALRNFLNLYQIISTRNENNFVLAGEVFKTVFSNQFANLNEKEADELVLKYLNNLLSKTSNYSSYGKAIYLADHLEWLLEEEKNYQAFVLNSITSKLYQVIEDIFARSYANGNELAQEIKDYITTSVEYEYLIEDKPDTVLITNIHKSKGLEAKIVIYVDNSKDDNKDSNTLKDGTFYIGELVKTINNNSDLDKIRRDDSLEKSRLEYVTVTRAEEAFIFTFDSQKGLFNRPGFDYDFSELRIIQYKNNEEEKEVIEEDEIEENSAKEYEINNQQYNVSDYLLKVISPSSLENQISETREKYKQENNLEPDPNRPRGNILGTIMHRAFELLIDSKDPVASTKLALAENQKDVSDYALYYDFILAASVKLDQYYKAQGYYELDLYPELTFSFERSTNIINNGSIDLLIKNGDDYIIIDYKSDEAEYISDDLIFEETLKEKYTNQLDAYEDTIKILFDSIKSIKKQIIYFRRYKRNSSIDLKVFQL